MWEQSFMDVLLLALCVSAHGDSSTTTKLLVY